MSVPVGLAIGAAVAVVGLVVVFAGGRPRGRVVGFVVLAVGAVLALVGAAPRSSGSVAVTVGVTLVPVLVVADQLRRRLERHEAAGTSPISLDDEPR